MFGSMHTFLLGQIIGLYMVIMAIIMVARTAYYREVLEDIRSDNIEAFFSASLWLFLGIILVTIHNIWVMSPVVIVTLVSWLILINAILWLAIPEFMLRITKQLYDGPGYYVMAFLSAIFGIILMSQGFYPFFEPYADFNPFN
jgi:hypothetical protein